MPSILASSNIPTGSRITIPGETGEWEHILNYTIQQPCREFYANNPYAVQADCFRHLETVFNCVIRYHNYQVYRRVENMPAARTNSYITLPGETGEWEQVDHMEYMTILGAEQNRDRNDGSEVSYVLGVLSRAWGREVRWINRCIYRQVDTAEWVKREKERMSSRTLPVWANESFWTVNACIHNRHFVYVSEKDRRLLAYTQDDDKGARDIQTPIKPGRYLRQYFKDVLSEKRIAFLASWQTSGIRPEEVSGTLQFATTPDEIAKVYMTGPKSCMGGGNFKDPKTHPAIVYGAGDLAIAYIVDELKGVEKPVARALVWPERKVAGRVYPTPEYYMQDGFETQNDSIAMQNRMSALLKGAGYTFLSEDGSFDGARILKKFFPGDKTKCIMPYMDNDLYIDKVTPEYFVLKRHSGKVRPVTQSGYISAYSFCFATCRRCEAGIEEQVDAVFVYGGYDQYRNAPQYQRTWCKACGNSRYAFKCEGSGHLYDIGCIVPVSFQGKKVCRDWRDATYFESGFSGTWFEKSKGFVEMDHGTVWTQEEFDQHGFTCEATQRRLPVTERHPDLPAVRKGLDVVAAREVITKLTSAQKATLLDALSGGNSLYGGRRKSMQDLNVLGLMDRYRSYNTVTNQGKLVGYLLKQAGQVADSQIADSQIADMKKEYPVKVKRLLRATLHCEIHLNNPFGR